MFSSFVYLVLGVVFTVFAVQQVTMNDWNFFAYLLIILATFDFGASFRLFSLHLKLKKQQKK
nr:DUF4305 domain-containing protein [Lederbergia citrea]